VGTISSDNRNVDIFVEHVDRGKSGSLWLFSSKTLDAIPDLYDEINVVSVDTFSRSSGEYSISRLPLFEWLAVFLLVCLSLFPPVLLNRLLSRSSACCAGAFQEAGSGQFQFLAQAGSPSTSGLGPFHWITSKLGFRVGTGNLVQLRHSLYHRGKRVAVDSPSSAGQNTAAAHPKSQPHGSHSMLRLTRWVVDLLDQLRRRARDLDYFGVKPNRSTGWTRCWRHDRCTCRRRRR